jgi:hypothetical protein
MEIFEPFLRKIDDPAHRARMAEVLGWVLARFPTLSPVIKWNQPMFTDHGTYIIGFSVAKHHIAIAPELYIMQRFAQEIAATGYSASQELIRIRWAQPVDFALLEMLISFKIADKADCKTFWR